MTLKNNQRGFSLLEALIAIGLTSAAGVAYMTQVETVNKNEARQRIRSSLNVLEAQALDYLKSKDVCSSNLSVAFDGVVLTGDTATGDTDYKSLRHKSFKDSLGNLVQKDIFKVGDLFEGGRIYVGSVSYDLSDLSTISVPNAPWNRSGKVKISVDFESCRNNGRVMDKDANGVLTEVCPVSDRYKVTKNFEKLVAFKLKADGTVNSSDIREQVMDQSSGIMQWQTTGTKKDLACADSQDALIEAAASYTDLKVCIAELKMLIYTQKTGKTECGLEVKSLPLATRSFEFTSSGQQQNLNLPEKYVFGDSINFLLVSGAGGGGFGGSGGHGGAGNPGNFRKFKSSDIPGGNFKNCKVVVGRGGVGAGQSGLSSGEATILKCLGASDISIAGGLVGADKVSTESNCGRKGLQLIIDGVAYGVGGDGRCIKSSSGSNGTIGSGGGGGANGGNTSSWRKDGTPGGNGFVRISYNPISITDVNNVLVQLGLNLDQVLDEMSSALIINK